METFRAIFWMTTFVVSTALLGAMFLVAIAKVVLV